MTPTIIAHLEDDIALRDIVRIQVAHLAEDVRLVQFETAEKLMRTLERHDRPHVDCFLLDIRLSGEMDGRQVAEWLREGGYNSPVFITSGFDTIPEDWLETWACDWVEKPTDRAKLEQIVLPAARAYRQGQSL